MMKFFKPTHQQRHKRKLYGFDIETYGEDNTFYCCSLYRDDYQKVFFKIDDFITELKRWKVSKNICIVATNLSFDFFGTFFKDETEKYFKLCWRGSDLLSAVTFVGKDGWSSSSNGGKYKIEFIDTMNYARLSVEKMGKILNLPKLKRPKALGKIPKDEEERKELIEYNLRDSEISYKFMRFLDDSFYNLGATPKITIASTSMSLFRNRYLKDTYKNHDIDILDKIMKGYYGGRTEVFERGSIKDYYYYDVNSLYPDVMRNIMPDPNSINIRKRGTIDHITGYEGFSEVKIYCPEMKYPLLPLRHDNKLIFPCGTFKGWYSHLELRKAISEGYTILDIGETIWFSKTCRPFKEFVEDLYSLRKQFKTENNPMELVTKLCMNSLYGKFAQSFRDREQLIHKDAITKKDIDDHDKIDRIGDYFRINRPLSDPAIFCFPEWSAYITSYARIKIYDLIKQSQAIYCDTDSIITKRQMPESKELGGLKLECYIEEGYIIKPKFYIFRYDKGEYVKVKGVMGKDIKTGKRLATYEKISYNLLTELSMKFEYHKFAKFRESIRRDLIPNSLQPVTKVLDIEDTKRRWKYKFDPIILQDSRPIWLKEDLTETSGDNQKQSYETEQCAYHKTTS